MDRATVETFYIPMWLQCLQYSGPVAAEASLYALRSWDWEIWGEGYDEDGNIRLWRARHPNSQFWCLITPQRGLEEAQRRQEELSDALKDLLDAQFHADRSLDIARGKARAVLGGDPD